jgi:dUTP pyrophosphatase
MDPVIKIKRLRNHKLPLPAYETDLAAGMDLRADIAAAFTIDIQQRVAIPTGFAIEIPRGYEGQVRPRSGLALRDGVTVANAPGTIDADYRGEVKVILINLGREGVLITPGERIAQLVISPVAHATLEEHEDLEETPRGSGGFGHTGR